MQRRNVATIQDATAKALAAQVQRTLGVMRIKGWAFPENCDVAVTIVAATPLVTRVKARMDDAQAEGDITPERAADDIAAIGDVLVALWLNKYATTKPERRTT